MKLYMKIKRDFIKVYIKSEVLKELKKDKKYLELKKSCNKLAKTTYTKFEERTWLYFIDLVLEESNFLRKKLLANILNKKTSRIYISENEYLEVKIKQKKSKIKDKILSIIFYLTLLEFNKEKKD